MALPKPWKSAGNPIESGQAFVFPVQRTDDECRYALKRLKNPDRADRFDREIRVTQKLHEDGLAVPEVLEHGVDDDGRPYFVMPWFEDGALAAQIDDGRYADDVEAGLRLLVQLAELLAEIHSRAGRAHRDVKPENVLLADGKPHLTDFGLSLSASEDDPETRLTGEREGAGSRFYIAPENEGGFNEEVDQRPADFYAFGKVGWEVLAGKRALAREYQKLPENQLAVLHRNADLEVLDDLFSDMIESDHRARLGDWEIVVESLGRPLGRLGGEKEQRIDEDLVSNAREAAKRVSTSEAAVESKRAEEERERRARARGELREALVAGIRSRDEDLSDISNDSAPLLRIQHGGAPDVTTAEELMGFGLASPPGLVIDTLTRSQLREGVPAAIEIWDGTSDQEIDCIHLGLHPIILGDRVWIVRGVQATRRANAAKAVLTTRGEEYGRWIGPMQLGLATTNAAARELAEETIEVGIRLFQFCAEQLDAGRKLSDHEVWGMQLWPSLPAGYDD